MRGFACWLGGRALRDRRGSVAIIAAVSMLPLVIAAGVAIDMSRLADGRSALQRAVDNAALSGAAAYVLYTETDSYNLVARTMAHSAFCNAATALPGGFTLQSPSGSTACGSGQGPGPVVSAVVGGYNPGTRGAVAQSGCTATHTVISGATCGFIVTVSATETVRTIFPFLLGGSATVSVTASAVNPFINLAQAVSPNFKGFAYNANSLWIYPLLLDANGAPDFTVPGALPDTSACTGNPMQTSCGSYTMLASTYFLYNCSASRPCNDNGTIFINGVVQNPVVGNAVITATTPLGIALESAGGATTSFGYNTSTKSKPQDKNCVWPATLAYNTVSQAGDANGYPLVTDSNGDWSVATHWFYSSFLTDNEPPDYKAIMSQGNAQVIPAVPSNGKPYNPTAKQAPKACPNSTSPQNSEPNMPTTFPTSGATNCSVYIIKDPTSLQPPSSYTVTSPSQTPTCWSPANTPGYQYAALSCQNYAGHNYVFFWNDMSGTGGGGTPFDNTDYGDGTLQVSCSGASYVVLIN